MFLKYFLLGVFLKAIAGFDDSITRIPIIARLTHTREGKIAFSIGTLIAMSVSIILSIALASFIVSIPFAKEITAGLIFILAALIFFDVFVSKPRGKKQEVCNEENFLQALQKACGNRLRCFACNSH